MWSLIIGSIIAVTVMLPVLTWAQQDTTKRDTAISDTLQKNPLRADTAAVISSAQDMVMTQETLVLTRPAADSVHFQQFFVQGMRFGPKKIIVFKFQTGQAGDIEVLKGSRIALTLPDSTTTAEFFNDVPERSVFDGITYGGLLTIKCVLSPETEALLNDKKVIRVQLEYLGGVFRLDLNDEQAALLHSVLAAIR